MDIRYWIDIIISVLAGISTCIPLVVALYKVFKQVIDEKNWNKVVAVVLDFMVEAEKQFVEGAAKKAWVLAGVRKSAETIGFNYDIESEKKVSDMIDAICEASKIINSKQGA